MKISGTAQHCSELYSKIRVRWGLIRIKAEITEGLILNIKFAGFNVVRRPLSEISGEKEEKKPELKEKKEKKRAEVTPAMIFSLKDCLIRILDEITLGHFYLRLRFGLEDAADTGMVYGYIMALKCVIFAEKRVDIDACPVFEGLVFEPCGSCEILIKRVYRLFIPLLGIYRIFSAENSQKKPSGID